MKRLLFCIAMSVFPATAHAQTFQLMSRDIRNGEQIKDANALNGSGCSGKDMSPELSWSGEPEGTQSFAVTMFDIDAPTGSGWWHWTIVNIPKTVHRLRPDAGNKNGSNVPAGAVQGRTDFGRPGYGGPCPPVGDKTHRYRFKVWAVKSPHLAADADLGGAAVGYLLNTNNIATSEIVAVSTR